MKRPVCICCSVLLGAGLSLAQSTHKAKAAERWNHALSTPLPTDKMGSFIRRSDQDILTLHDTASSRNCLPKRSWICWLCD